MKKTKYVLTTTINFTERERGQIVKYVSNFLEDKTDRVLLLPPGVELKRLQTENQYRAKRKNRNI